MSYEVTVKDKCGKIDTWIIEAQDDSQVQQIIEEHFPDVEILSVTH